MQLAYFKDRFRPESECVVSINDRSFRFGDGVFETFLVYNGRLYDAEHHMQRLERGLVNFRIPVDTGQMLALSRELIARNGLKEGFIRIVVSRGENGPGAVGYLPKGTSPYLLIQSLEKTYPVFANLKLYLSSQLASVHTPSKTNNALIYTLAMMEAEEHGCHNALLLDGNGHICETGSGNIFWIKGDTLYTPSTDLPLVPGTMRRKVLEQWHGDKQEGYFTLEALKAADEIFMTNIANLAAAVVAIEPLSIILPAGEHTKRVRSLLDRDIINQCADA